MALFQERGAHGRKGVNKDAVLEALASVHNVRNLHQYVASLNNLGFAIDGELKFATLNVGDLHMRMAMEFTLRAFLELHLHHHEVVVVSHYLAINLAWIASALPFLVGIEYERITLCCDVACIDDLTIVGHGDYAMRSCGEGAVGAAWFVTSHWFGLVAFASCKQGGKGDCEKNLFHKKQLLFVKY